MRIEFLFNISAMKIANILYDKSSVKSGRVKYLNDPNEDIPLIHHLRSVQVVVLYIQSRNGLPFKKNTTLSPRNHADPNIDTSLNRETRIQGRDKSY